VSAPTRVAFYDLDGTLISGNVVTRYAFCALHDPSPLRAGFLFARLVAEIPYWIALDLHSRRRFNEAFYRKYRGRKQDWLEHLSEPMFQQEVLPKIYPGAKPLLDADRADGFRLVLVTGALDCELPPVTRHFGFDHAVSNRLVFRDGRATGELEPPVLAEREKQEALRRFCRDYNVDTAQSKAYSDSFSDVSMLESVGLPAAVHPDRRLRRVARARGWPILNLKKGYDGDTRRTNT